MEEFATWANLNDVRKLMSIPLDSTAAEYMDYLFLEGFNHERGDKLLAALGHRFPALRRGRGQNFPLARAALQGFRFHAHGTSRSPLPLQAVFAMIGLACHFCWLEIALAIALGWDGYFRMPSDLFGMTEDSLIPPLRGSASRAWAILLYPEEQERRSKTAGADEGMLLTLDAFSNLSDIFQKL